ncbi:hypothetical protein AAMO2058_000838300 [Amorphochlora amoebiformis]
MARFEGYLLWGAKASILAVWGAVLFLSTCHILVTFEATENDVLPRQYRLARHQKKAAWYKGAGDRGDFLIYNDPKRKKFPTFSFEIKQNRKILNRWAESREHGSNKKYRILIATLAFIGPVVNGGIGTACTNLAEALTHAGHEVSVLYLWGTAVQQKSIDYWVQHYAALGITLEYLPETDIKLFPSTPSKYLGISYRTYKYLQARESDYDLLHFHEWHGPGYYTAIAKKQGLAFQKTTILTTIHCPSMFFLHGNFGYLTQNNNFVSDYIERQQVEMSDIVVSPSNFMLQWVQGRGWNLPKRTFVQQNILNLDLVKSASDPEYFLSGPSRRMVVGSSIDEIIFFGRLEVLKGLKVFCAALSHLRKISGVLERIKTVTFLGHNNLGNTDAEKFVKTAEREGNWGVKIKMLSNLIQPEATAYIKEKSRLCVMPSLLENSPYVVLEAMALHVPFLVSNVGGIPELIHPEDQDILFTPKPIALAKLLKKSLEDGVKLARPAFHPKDTLKQYLEFHQILAAKRLQEKSAGSSSSNDDGLISDVIRRHNEVLVSVCLVHHNRGHLVLKTIEAVLAQDYWPFELIFVDDGSNDKESLRVINEIRTFFNETKVVPFRFIRTPNRYPGAARNTAAEAAKGKFVVFCDDDDIPKPNWLSTLVSVAHNTHADVVTSMADMFHGYNTPLPDAKPDFRWLSVGGAADLGMFHNVFGSSQALVRKKSFYKIGGYSEEGESTFEDWEFFATTVLQGFHLESVPEALIWYRQRPRSAHSSLMSNTNMYTNRLRALRAYQRVIPPSIRNAVLYGWGMSHRSKKKNPGLDSSTQTLRNASDATE